ncbi:sugar kinase [Anaeromicropila populeti]|uniref:2-dehydro-3-deoxygluconokinase n=1 Tax=Anaeromicropila populeti TaxID=37658 RepID=A0A1I6J205_9FIRM|nr:sugar kinase [Anaeromicropila populeti]SFR73044.1 2-dehydro-3-deoxygluconokinase [Anaeromicropila populeti]
METSNKKYDLLALGEILLKLAAPKNERLVRGDILTKQAGGAELNVISGASLLGLKTGIISKLPDNDLGIFIQNQASFLGVSHEYLVYDNSPEARLGIYYYENGAYPRKPSVVYDRKNSTINNISIHDFPDSLYKSTRCFHTSGITLALSQQAQQTAIEMIKRFKNEGALISFDVNYRSNLWTGAQAKECIEQILPYVDIFFCSEDTARLTFLKTGTAKEINKSFTEEYPISIVASTQRIVHSPKSHTFGSTIYDAKNDCYYEEEPYRNIEVVDRIGSGDAYISGALYGLLSSDMNCQTALEYGNATASVKNTIPGDLLSSSHKEIDQIIKAHKDGGPQSEMNR